jgi:uncharacterized protein (UPF0305 family)
MKNLNDRFQQDLDEFGLLDVLSLVSFFQQQRGIKANKDHSEFIDIVFKALVNEIEQLHNENFIIMEENEKSILQNDKIIEQNEEIIRLMRKVEDGIN